jgi:hypothetical protein
MILMLILIGLMIPLILGATSRQDHGRWPEDV